MSGEMERIARKLEYSAEGKAQNRLYSFSPSVLIMNLGVLCLGLLLGSYSPFPGISPFGTACVMAAWFSGANPYFACFGAILGSLLSGEPAYAAAAAAIGAAIFLFGRRGSPARVYRLLISFGAEAGTLLLIGLFSKLQTALLIGSACVSVFAGVVAGSGLRAFSAARGTRPLSDTELLTLSALAGLVTLSMRSFSIWGQSPALVFAGACALFAAFRFGIPAVAFAVTVGAGRLPASGGDLHFIAVLAAAALFSASLRALGKWASLIGFASASLILTAALRGTGVFSYYEIGLICLIFALVPMKLYMPGEVFEELSSPLSAGKKHSLLQYRIASLSEVLSELARVYGGDTGLLLRCISNTLKSSINASRRIRSAFSYECGQASRVKPGSVRSGDSSAISNIGGSLLLALSDGMGSGEEASNESRAALALLKDLLRVGFPADDASECVNSLLSARGSGDMYATLDVMFVDEKGVAHIKKHGAPPSFILRDGRVFTLCGEDLPIGIIENARAEARNVMIKAGDTVIMMTDGVYDALGSGLAAAVETNVLDWGDPEIAANSLLEAARELSDEGCGGDDMTVIVARFS